MRTYKRNYFSGWIENLGVLPLLRSAAFLFAPILVFLRFLILRVCCVFDAMVNLLSHGYCYHLIRDFLSRAPLIVKTITYGVTLSLCFQGKAQTSHLNEDTLVLARGEQHTFDKMRIKTFSIGNKQVIAHKFKEATGLRVKGKTVGYSDLKITYTTGKVQKLHVYVIRKSKHLKLIQKSELFQSLGISTQIKGDQIRLSGEVNQKEHYQKIFKYIHHDKDLIINHLTVSPLLLKTLIATLYKDIAEMGYQMFKCESVTATIHCHLYADKHDKDDIAFLKSKVPFVEHLKKSIHGSNNFLIKIKLLLFENTKGEVISPGFDKILGSPVDIFSGTWKSFVGQNSTQFQHDNLKVSVLAEPQILSRLNSSTAISVGSDIPFTIAGNNQALPQLSWQFAGLRVQMEIEEINGKLALTYESELTNPDQENITGNKEKGSVYFEEGQPFHLFQIAFKSLSYKNTSIPFINKVPILKHLFSSSEDRNTYKMINGYLEVLRK